MGLYTKRRSSVIVTRGDGRSPTSPSDSVEIEEDDGCRVDRVKDGSEKGSLVRLWEDWG